MVQKEFKEIVFEFAKNVSSLDNVKYVFLFGSVAREEADKRSDIDFCVIINDNNKKNISKVALDLEKKYDMDIQLVVSKNFLKLDKYFISKLFEEGVLVYSKESFVNVKGIRYRGFLLVSYSLRNLSHKDKMKIKTKLYGYSTEKKVNKKIYKSSYKGLVKELEGLSVGAGAVLVPLRNAKYILNILDEFKVRYDKTNLLKEVT